MKLKMQDTSDIQKSEEQISKEDQNANNSLDHQNQVTKTTYVRIICNGD